ncbi:MAG TPA: type II secretion system secretin GspD [Pseudolabrys sp.]|nr:type II secretion system secretin GspD [Pseudolabrys sp.]
MSRDLTARSPAPAAPRAAERPLPGAEIFPGDAASTETRNEPEISPAQGAEPGATGAVARGTDQFDLNFQNADVAAISKVIMGDLLKTNYSLDPRVQGTINLASGRPVAKRDLLPLFESTLKLVNAQIVKEGGVYKIVPAGEALGAGPTDTDARVTSGYGISVMPLRYVSAAAVLRALDSFAVKPGAARVDPGRNLLMIQGSSTERQSAIEAALALDVDWMRNQSVGIFPIRNTSPDTMIKELGNVFDAGREGNAANLVRFQPMNRLNAVLAIAQSNAMIDKVKTWVTRLDRADYDNTMVRVYHLRYGNAKVLAGILKEVFTGQANTTGSSDLSQLTPGSTMRRATSPGSTTTSPPPGSNPPGSPGFGNPPGTGTDQTSSTQNDRTSSTGTDISSLSTTGSSGPAILPNVRITADIANNSLLIYASRDQYKIVERAIFELDRAPMQVAIDVTVAEVTLKNELQNGVQYFLGNRKDGSIGFGLSNVLARTLPGGNLVLGKNSDPHVVINALSAVTDVHVISSPSLVVLDNQQARLQVGDQVPITTQQATDVTVPNAPLVSSVTMQDTGVILKVTPRVNANGVVSLDVSQEVSAVQPTANATLTPTISERKVQSTIAVASGQTVMLAGMISSTQQNTRNGLPILGDLKGIGDLFATNDKQSNRTELIVFIRPQIIRNGLDAQLVAEELRSKLSVVAREAVVPAGANPHNFLLGR